MAKKRVPHLDEDPILVYRLSDRLLTQRIYYMVIGLWLFVGGGMALNYLGLH